MRFSFQVLCKNIFHLEEYIPGSLATLFQCKNIVCETLLCCSLSSSVLQSPDHDRHDEHDDDHEEPQAVIDECLSAFSSVDNIMEPGVFNMLQR